MSTGNPGEAAAAIMKVREAIKILQQALPAVPVGTDIHKSLLKAITDLSKVAPQAEASPGTQQTTFRDLQAQAQQTAPMMALMRALGSKAPGMAGAGAGAQPQGAAPG